MRSIQANNFVRKLTDLADVTVTAPSSSQVLSYDGAEWINDEAPESADTYIHVQSVASSSWTITHNLGRFPSVTIIDSGNSVVEGNREYIDSNTILLTFSGAFSGKAYLN